jgi:DivIVA domain-containing protein
MASDGRPELDPQEIARAAFPTAFRGYDQDTVRRYLRALAAAVTQAQHRGTLGSLHHTDDDAQLRVVELEQEAVELQDRVDELEELLGSGSELAVSPVVADGADAAEAVAAMAVPARELDEAELIALLGQETARVLETARSAAADITQRARAEAASLTEQAASDAGSARDEAEAVLEAARTEAEEILAAASAEAQRSHDRIKADAKRSRDEATAEAERLLAEAQNEAGAEVAAARQHAGEMLFGAEQLRTEILSNLAQRQRAGQNQLERLVAARDRLANALAGARDGIDGVAADIQMASPDGAVLDLTAGDTEGGGEVRQPSAAELEALLARLEPVRAERPAPAIGARSEFGTAAAFAGDDDVSFSPAPNGSTAVTIGEPAELPTPEVAPAEVAPAGVERQIEDGSAAGDLDRPMRPEVGKRPGAGGWSGSEGAEGGDDVDVLDLDGLGWSDGPVLGGGRGSLHRAAMRGDLPRNTPYGGTLPAAFEVRDIALSRATPGFRRRLRRAVNDDQSDVLDRLRAGRGEIRPGELAAVDEQLRAYIEALRPVLVDMVSSGGELLDSLAVPVQAVENLCHQLARHLVDTLRAPTIASIDEATSDDREAILDPIRAIYRDFSNAALPDLIDDALHEAFALGAYHAVDGGERLIWVPDPRLDPDPICEENSASPALAKGTSFPSGHARPLSMPGCRCLVLPLG